MLPACLQLVARPVGISNRHAQVIDPLDPCNWLDPFVPRCCSDFQDAFSPAGSRDLPSSGLAFNLCIGFVTLAQRVNIPDVDQYIRFFYPATPSFART